MSEPERRPNIAFTRNPAPSRDGSAALKDVTTLTITGTFEYQACDDKVCFAPQSLPLSWSIGVKPLDRERAKPQQEQEW